MAPQQTGYIIGLITGTLSVSIVISYLFILVYENMTKKKLKRRWLKIILFSFLVFIAIVLYKIGSI